MPPTPPPTRQQTLRAILIATTCFAGAAGLIWGSLLIGLIAWIIIFAAFMLIAAFLRP
jgi:hypothetical protein